MVRKHTYLDLCSYPTDLRDNLICSATVQNSSTIILHPMSLERYYLVSRSWTITNYFIFSFTSRFDMAVPKSLTEYSEASLARALTKFKLSVG